MINGTRAFVLLAEEGLDGRDTGLINKIIYLNQSSIKSLYFQGPPIVLWYE